jgi:hypothetical protein
MMFYVLAPMHVLAGDTGLGIDAGAIIVNVGSLACIWWMLRRRRDIAAPYLASAAILFAIYLARMPSLVSSPWNPHLCVLPFTALLVLSAAAATGDLFTLPLVAAAASFVAQSHAGYVPVVLALLAVVGVSALWRAVVDPARRVATVLWSLFALELLQLLWTPVLIEQFTARPGNLTAMWRFFAEDSAPQAWSAALRNWSGMLLSVFRPDLQVPLGVPYDGPASAWAVVAALLLAAVPAGVAVRDWRRGGRDLPCAITLLSALAALVAAWSASRVRGPLGDYQLFWLSTVGIFDAAALTAFVGARWKVELMRATRMATAGGIVVVGLALMLGVADLRRSASGADRPEAEQVIAFLAPRAIQALPSTGNRRPAIRLDDNMFTAGTGLVLQFARARVDFTLARDLTALFGLHRGTDGREDALIDICTVDRHQALIERPGNVTLAQDPSHGLFIDAISLVDHPEYRVE